MLPETVESTVTNVSITTVYAMPVISITVPSSQILISEEINATWASTLTDGTSIQYTDDDFKG